MFKLGLVFLISLFSGRICAQDYFVLLQSGNRQPFYVRLGPQFYGSSSDGHLILSQLKDSTYTIAVGFPAQPGVERSFSFSPADKDRAFEIRDRGEAGWGLYDSVAQDWLAVQATKSGREEPRAIGVRRDDAFSRLMADVVRDTAVLYNDYANSEIAVTDSGSHTGTGMAATDTTSGSKASPDTLVAAILSATGTSPGVVRADSLAIYPGQTDSLSALTVRPAQGAITHKSPPAVDPTVGGSVKAQPGIVKLSEKKLARSRRLVFADMTSRAGPDTVVVIIPLDTPQSTVAARASRTNSQDANGSAGKSRPASPDSGHSGSPVRSGNTDSVRSVPIIVPTPVNSSAGKPRTGDSDQNRQAKAPAPYINSDCHAFATDYDVDKLRVKMLEAAKDEDRIAVAQKVFRTKCFYTRQVRALSEVFAGDASKYRFFEAAYPFAADEHFRELQVLLNDPVYAGKFRTLTGMH